MGLDFFFWKNKITYKDAEHQSHFFSLAAFWLEHRSKNHQQIEKHKAARCRAEAGRRKCPNCRAQAGQVLFSPWGE